MKFNFFSELATYHHNAPYQSQNSCATFLISGTLKKMDSYRKDSYEDVDMDQTQGSENVEDRNGTEEDDSDEISQTTVRLVNEKDLEGAVGH
jgi:DNA polymerase delta subunit 3